MAELYGKEHKKMVSKGAKQRQAKISKVMHEYGRGELKSSSGQKVTNPKQAVVIGYSEAERMKKKK